MNTSRIADIVDKIDDIPYISCTWAKDFLRLIALESYASHIIDGIYPYKDRPSNSHELLSDILRSERFPVFIYLYRYRKSTLSDCILGYHIAHIFYPYKDIKIVLGYYGESSCLPCLKIDNKLYTEIGVHSIDKIEICSIYRIIEKSYPSYITCHSSLNIWTQDIVDITIKNKDWLDESRAVLLHLIQEQAKKVMIKLYTLKCNRTHYTDITIITR